MATLILTPVYLAYAQKQAKTPRIGVLLLGAPPNPNLDAFIQGLQELGYVEGKNVLIEYRFAEGKADRLPGLAMELVRLKVDAIFTAGTPAIFALKRATNSIPIVFFSTSDPIGTGCRRYSKIKLGSKLAVSYPMGPTTLKRTGAPLLLWTKFLKARSLPTCLWSSRQGLSW